MRDVWRHENLGAKYAAGWIVWPAKTVTEFEVALNYNNALSSYKSSTNKVEWTRRNPAAWDVVACYLSTKIHRAKDGK